MKKLVILFVAVVVLVLGGCEEREVTISFNSNGGTEISDIVVEGDESFSLPTTPTKEGYTFSGWYLDENFETSYDAETSLEEDVTLYAMWEVNTYTLTYEDHSGDIILYEEVEYGTDLSNFNVPSPLKRNGYVFEGWNRSLPETMPGNDLRVYPFYKLVYWYDYVDDGIVILDYIGEETELTIPETIDGLIVVGLADNSFKDKELDSVTIPNGVTTIGYNAFSWRSLTGFDIGDNPNFVYENNLLITADGTTLITGIGLLTSVTIPDGVTTIKEGAFDFNDLEHIIIPDGVTTIEKSAFAYNNLTNVILPNNVTTIGESAFVENQLTTLVIPDSVTSIGHTAFARNNLTSVTISESITEIEQSTFAGNQLTTVVIPDGVTSIGYGAFWYNNLTSVIIPNSVTNIGDYAFYENNLTNVTIPSGITVINSLIFGNNQLTTVIILDGVTSIKYGAFSENNLTSVIMPDSVTLIEEEAFAYNQLTSISLPDSLTQIGNNSFAGNQLDSVVIPNTVTQIGETAFAFNNITTLTIPETVEILGPLAFDWYKIEDLTIENNSNFIYEDKFLYSADKTTLIAAVGPMSTVVIPDGVITIGEAAFANNYVRSLTIPDSVTTINSYAFLLNNIIRVVFSEGLTTIEERAFYDNDITNLTIPSSVTDIGRKAFLYNDFTSITINGDLTRFNDDWDDIGFPNRLKPSSS